MEACADKIVDHELVGVASASLQPETGLLGDSHALDKEVCFDDAFGSDKVEGDIPPGSVAVWLAPAGIERGESAAGELDGDHRGVFPVLAEVIVANLCLHGDRVFPKQSSEQVCDVNDVVNHRSPAGEAWIDEPSKGARALVGGADAEQSADLLVRQLAHEMSEIGGVRAREGGGKDFAFAGDCGSDLLNGGFLASDRLFAEDVAIGFGGGGDVASVLEVLTADDHGIDFLEERALIGEEWDSPLIGKGLTSGSIVIPQAHHFRFWIGLTARDKARGVNVGGAENSDAQRHGSIMPAHPGELPGGFFDDLQDVAKLRIVGILEPLVDDRLAVDDPGSGIAESLPGDVVGLLGAARDGVPDDKDLKVGSEQVECGLGDADMALHSHQDNLGQIRFKELGGEFIGSERREGGLGEGGLGEEFGEFGVGTAHFVGDLLGGQDRDAEGFGDFGDEVGTLFDGFDSQADSGELGLHVDDEKKALAAQESHGVECTRRTSG